MKRKIIELLWFLAALSVETAAVYAIATIRRHDFGRSELFASTFAFECLGLAVVTWLRCDASRGPVGFAVGTTLGASLVVAAACTPTIPMTAGWAWLTVSALALTGYRVGHRGITYSLR